MFLFSTIYRPTMGSTQPPIQRAVEVKRRIVHRITTTWFFQHSCCYVQNYFLHANKALDQRDKHWNHSTIYIPATDAKQLHHVVPWSSMYRLTSVASCCIKSSDAFLIVSPRRSTDTGFTLLITKSFHTHRILCTIKIYFLWKRSRHFKENMKTIQQWRAFFKV